MEIHTGTFQTAIILKFAAAPHLTGMPFVYSRVCYLHTFTQCLGMEAETPIAY